MAQLEGHRAHEGLRRAEEGQHVEQGSTQSVIRHTEEVLVGDEAAAPGV